MALQFIDGFDHYYLSNDVGFTGGTAAITQKWDTTLLAGEMYPQLNVGRFGKGALRVKSSAGGAHVQKNVPTPKDELIVGFAFLPNATSAWITEIRFVFSTAEYLFMNLNMSTGTMSVVSSNGAVNTVTSAGVLTVGVWSYIEFRVKVHSTAGEVEVYKDEVQKINLTSVNTGTTGATIQNLRITSTNNLQLEYIDDLYLLDTTGATNNTFLGDSRIGTLNTSADGAINTFSRTSDNVGDTSNYLAVQDEDGLLSDRDHSYVESGLIGASEAYTNKTLAAAGILSISNIYGVQVVNNTKKTATGVLRFKDEMVIAGTVYDNGTEVTASTGDYHMSTFIRDTDPSDSAAWTEAKVDAVGSGFSITFREV